MFYHHHHKSNKGVSGFSLVEAILTVGILTVLLFLGIVAMTLGGATTERQKLEYSAATLNSAVQLYLTSGGSLAGIEHPEEVIHRLKKGPEDSDQAAMLGPFIDPSLQPVMMTASEAASLAPRVRWEPSTLRFEVTEDGELGIKKFIQSDSMSSSGENYDDGGTYSSPIDNSGASTGGGNGGSSSNNSNSSDPGNSNSGNGSSNDGTYSDGGNSSGGAGTTGGSSEGTQSTGGNSEDDTEPYNQDAETLSTPTVNINLNVLRPEAAPAQNTINNPNPEGSSEIYYQIRPLDRAPLKYKLYKGTFFTAYDQYPAGYTISAYAKAVDPKAYRDSAFGSAAVSSSGS